MHINNSIIACIGFLGGCAVTPPPPITPPDVSEPLKAPTPVSSEIDHLISRLPPMGSETDWQGDQWVLKPAPARMKALVEGGAPFSADQWTRILTGTRAVRVRDRWPVDEPFAISMQLPAWLDLTQIRMVPRNPGLAPAKVGTLHMQSCATCAMGSEQAWLHQELGPLERGFHQVVFDVTIERGENGWGKLLREPVAPAGILWQGVMTFPVEIVRTIDKAVPPVSSPSLDEAVRKSLSLAFTTGSEGRSAILVIDPKGGKRPDLAGIGLSLKVEVREGRRVRQRLLLRPMVYDGEARVVSLGALGDKRFAFNGLDSIPAALEHDADSRANWTIKVLGASDRVWKLWGAEQRWAGEITIPVAELIERELENGPKERDWDW